MTPEHIITHAIRYDHKPGANARDIIAALETAGYQIAPASSSMADLPEVVRTYGLGTMRTNNRTWIDATVEA